MLLSCTVCHKNIELKDLHLHMKYVHLLTEKSSIYKCTHESCDRSFSNTNSFRKHVSSHKTTIQNPGEFIKFQGNNTSSVFEIEAVDQQNLDNVIPDIPFPSDKSLHESALAFVSNLYSDSSLSRGQVQRFVDLFHSFLNNNYINALKRIATDTSKNIDKTFILEKFENIQSVLADLNSEHKRLRILETCGSYIKPESILLGYTEMKGKDNVLENREVFGQYVPLGSSLKAFLEVPGTFAKISKYCSELRENSTDISNIMQSDYWKFKTSHCNSNIVFPLFLYQDDFETGNPLGTHAGIYKLNALYVLLPCIPPEYRSRLNNIFLTQLFHSDDAKTFSKSVIYSRLINDLNMLETKGLEIISDGKSHHVCFIAVLMLGDNLGLHSTLSFVESFRANFSCRFCKVPRDRSMKLCSEDESVLRTQDNYEIDVLKNDVASTGIKELCIWNKVDSFHVVQNYSIDIMHDLLEGVCSYEMSSLLKYLILEKKYFDLDTLNCRIKFFDYPCKVNQPTLISVNILKSGHLKMSAAEMKCFMLHAGLIFGDLIPVENDRHWELFQLLRQILSICLQSCITPDTANLLESLITEHHSLFVFLYGNCLKPKHHHMLHYGRIMKQIGPLRHIWSMRLEAKHQGFKQTAKVTCNRINICRTLAIKHQLNMSDSLLQQKQFSDNIKYKKHNVATILPNIDEQNLLANHANFVQIKHVIVNHFKYKPGVKILLRVDEFPVFGEIKQIYFEDRCTSPEKKNFAFIVNVFEVAYCDDHLQAYKVEDTSQLEFISLESCTPDEQFNIIRMSDGNLYISYI